MVGVVEVASCPQVAYAGTAGKRLSSNKAFVVVHPAPAVVSGFYRPNAAPRCWSFCARSLGQLTASLPGANR
jgi:hypothetical protein